MGKRSNSGTVAVSKQLTLQGLFTKPTSSDFFLKPKQTTTKPKEKRLMTPGQVWWIRKNLQGKSAPKKWREKEEKDYKIKLTDQDTHCVHFVYNAYSPAKKKDYPGYTNKPKTRIRQHQGKIKRGAKKTKRMKDPNMRFAWTVCPFMNRRDALQFEESMRRDCKAKNSAGRLKFAIESLADPQKLWRPKSIVPAGDPRRALHGKFHLFLFDNLPTTAKIAQEIDTLLATHKDKLVVCRSATIEKVEAHRKAEIKRLKAWKAEQVAKQPESQAPFALKEIAPKWSK